MKLMKKHIFVNYLKKHQISKYKMESKSNSHVCVVLTTQICENIEKVCTFLKSVYSDSSKSIMLLNKKTETLSVTEQLNKSFTDIGNQYYYTTNINEHWSFDKIANEVYLTLPKSIVEEQNYIMSDMNFHKKSLILSSSRNIRYIYGLWDDELLPPSMERRIELNKAASPLFRSTVMYKNDVFSLMDEDVIALFKKIKRKVVLADISRYYVMWKLGGFYLDLDVIVNKDLVYIVDACITSNQSIMLFTEHDYCHPMYMGPRENREHTKRIYNCMFWSKPNQTFWKKCIDLAITRCNMLINDNIQWTDQDVLWASGPDVVTTVYNSEYSMDPSVKLYDHTVSIQYLVHMNGGSWRNEQDIPE